jgi:hypothetical protein
MARTVQDLVDQLRRWLPEHFGADDPLFGGIAAAVRQGEIAAETLQPLATVGGSVAEFLDLQAAGYGVLRGGNEDDATLQQRLRQPDRKVTRNAILDAVNALIAPDEAAMIEWFDEPYLDAEDFPGALWLDSARLLDGPSGFLIVIPSQGPPSSGDYLGSEYYLDSSYLGTQEPGIYAGIINEVQRARAAGVYWALVMEE